MNVDEIRITPLTHAAIPACATLMAGLPLWQRYGVTVESARRLFEDGLSHGEAIRVAWLGEQAVGFVWFTLSGTFYHSGYVRYIGVDPAVQARGVGRALMEAAEAEIFAHSPNVFLLVSDFNTQAQAFYARLGYQKVGELADYVLPGVTEYVFRKTRGSLRCAASSDQTSPVRSG